MKIQCLIRRNGGSHVTFEKCERWPAGHYHFKPESDAYDAPHVATVPEELHQHRLLGMPDVYRIVPTGATLKAPDSGSVIVPPKQPETPQTPGAPPPPADPTTPPAGVSPERIAEIRELTIKELKGRVNTFTADELRAALDAEKSRQDDSPRKGWLEVIEAHVGAAG